MSSPTEAEAPARYRELIENLHGFYTARARALPQGEVIEEPGAIRIRSGVPNPELNILFVTTETPDPVAAVRRAAGAFGTDPWRLEVPGPLVARLVPLARERNLEGPESRPALTLLPDRLARSDPPPGFAVETARTVEERRRFYDTVMRGFAGHPLPEGSRIGEIEVRGATLLLGLHDGDPVAAATLFGAGRVAGVYGVATVPAARRAGYGRAITEAAIVEGFRRGGDIAFLQATPMAYAIYVAMGFVPAFDHSVWYARS